MLYFIGIGLAVFLGSLLGHFIYMYFEFKAMDSNGGAVLSDKELLERGDSLIYPFEYEQIQPVSYDLRLDEDALEKTVIAPHEFMLVSTIETIAMPDTLMGIVAGKSSIARLGLSVECAGIVDAGFCGQITLELYNQSDEEIDLTQFKGICQIIFFELVSPAETPYNGHYQNQLGATESYLKNEIKSR